MKYSNFFGKTQKLSKEFNSKNASLLIKAGFIDQVMAGVYTYLPLGKRVLSKIEKIIREEMDKVAFEIFMPSISPKELWEKTNRLETIDVLFKASGANSKSIEKNNSEYVLNSTHEELVTPLAKKFNLSYKDLPLCLYQIQTKFRNEARPKSGLMRGREFSMKDAYSFHTDEKDLLEFYETIKQVYKNIFNRIGIGEETVVALASGGDFTKEYSHEFQTICDSGEDTLFQDTDTGIIYNKEVTPSKAPLLESTEEEKPMENVFGEGIIGVEELANFLKIPVGKTTKTIIFENEKGEILAAAVRGGYVIDEEKLKKVTNSSKLSFLEKNKLIEITGAEPGYAGILNLPKNIKVIIDDSVINRKNFECGANQTNYHSINVNFGRDLPYPEKVYDIKVAKEGDLNPDTNKKYKTFKASEVGNIFPLNTKFSEAFDYKFKDEDGTEKIVYMGCYGIGPSRVMGVVAEKFNDENGLIWPKNIAPFNIHLISIGAETVNQKAHDLYNQLIQDKFEVLWDDRTSISPGEKFSDADLIGIPIRIVVSERSLKNGGIEVKKRDQKDSQIVSLEKIAEFLHQT